MNNHVQALVQHVYEQQMMALESAKASLGRVKEEVEYWQKEVARLDERAAAFADFLAGK